MAGISHVSDKVKFGQEETSYGTLSADMSLDMGHIQSLSMTENEGLQRINSVNGGFTTNKFEDGVYYVSGTLETLATKASLPNILEAFFGSRSDSTDYTITPSSTVVSYSMQAEYTTGYYAQIVGVVFTTISIDVTRDGNIAISMDYVGKKLTLESGSLSVSASADNIFLGLDASMTYGGSSLVANSFSLSASWNVDDTEGRGVESVSAGERRLIQRVFKHALELDGSFEVYTQNNFEMGFTADRSDSAFIFTVARGSDNEHVFTVSAARTETKELTVNTDNSVRVMIGNYQGIGITVTGDL